ncbi:hypothetical protein L484_014019 [Morus notabilis]|uniref:Uncharacterized protein n=1 Tax=Morus notabilis TaxID=981085 RepID=W9RBI5_9ROSA|nr:hypothetical protein L484_014019 [Morus notabilis]
MDWSFPVNFDWSQVLGWGRVGNWVPSGHVVSPPLGGDVMSYGMATPRTRRFLLPAADGGSDELAPSRLRFGSLVALLVLGSFLVMACFLSKIQSMSFGVVLGLSAFDLSISIDRSYPQTIAMFVGIVFFSHAFFCATSLVVTLGGHGLVFSGELRLEPSFRYELWVLERLFSDGLLAVVALCFLAQACLWSLWLDLPQHRWGRVGNWVPSGHVVSPPLGGDVMSYGMATPRTRRFLLPAADGGSDELAPSRLRFGSLVALLVLGSFLVMACFLSKIQSMSFGVVLGLSAFDLSISIDRSYPQTIAMFVFPKNLKNFKSFVEKDLKKALKERENVKWFLKSFSIQESLMVEKWDLVYVEMKRKNHTCISQKIDFTVTTPPSVYGGAQPDIHGQITERILGKKSMAKKPKERDDKSGTKNMPPVSSLKMMPSDVSITP